MNTESNNKQLVQFTISSTTNRVLNCLRVQDYLFSVIEEAVCEVYGESQVEKIMDDMFYNQLSDVRGQIFELLKGSIESSLGNIGSTEI